MLDDGQAKSSPAHLPGTSFVYAIEALKQTGKFFGWNSGARVADIELHHLGGGVRRPPAAKPDRAVLRRVFDRVIQKVAHHLMYCLGIAKHLVLVGPRL